MSRSRTRRAAVALAAVLALSAGLAGCGSGGGNDEDAGGTITVFAAASLTEAFTTIGKQFEKAHPGTDVKFSFGPSSGLQEQIQQGAPADVFASASTTNMDAVVASGDAGDPTTFVRNQMEIAVPADNPGHVTELADLARPGVKLALCQAEVPCGVVAAEVFHNAGMTVHPVTREVDVKSVLTKVALGEVDAGVVYVTDVRAAGSKVTGIDIPADVNASTDYPIATLKASKDPDLADEFVRYVLSPAGAKVLQADGFAKP